MSYSGKSSAAAMAAIAAVYGTYFLWAREPGRGPFEVLTHMIGAIIAIAIIATVLEILIAISIRRSGSSPHRTDERDSLIGARSARNGYYALLSMIWILLFLALRGASGVLIANSLLAMIVLAELVNFGSRVFYDGRGA